MDEILLKVGNGAKPIKSHQILTMWYGPAALILLDGAKTENAEKRICALLDLPKQEAQLLIDNFLNEKLIKRQSGKFHMTKKYLHLHDKKSFSKTHRAFLRQQLQLSQKKLESSYDKNAKFFSHTFSISSENFQKYFDKIETFLDEIAHSSNKEPIEEIAQINIQYFCL